MPLPPSNREEKLLRFGTFEVNLTSGELRRNGSRVRLQEQPFQVLVTLLQNAGQVVTRNELREKIWPADTFVDFDHSLNTAVNKIRESLGDSASNPRFVETLARRGYRFIASVTNSMQKNDPQSEEGRSKVWLSSESAFHPELHVPMPHRGAVRGLFVLIQVMYLIFYLSALAHLRDADYVISRFVSGWRVMFFVAALFITAVAGIPLRLYLLSAVAFDFRKLGDTFTRLFPAILVLDQLWAIAPLLLSPQIGVGLAFAATAALLYVPFSERTLVRMAYRPES